MNDMKKYVSQVPVTLHAGLVVLSEEDAKARLHNLYKTSEEGVYGIKNPIQFKAGQVFQYDGDIPKKIATLVSEVDEEAEAEEEQQDEGVDNRPLAEKALDWLIELEAEGLLDINNKDSKAYLTKSGVIECKVIEERFGTKIQASWRDDLWTRFMNLPTDDAGEE